MKTCTVEGCDKAHRARGLCATHYNQKHQPERHRKTETPCDCCGTPVLKASNQRERWGNVYCSYLCRDYTKFGPLSSKLPSDHISKCLGMTCSWAAPKPPRAYTCDWCGSEGNTSREHQSYCTRLCKTKAGKARRRAAEHAAPGTYRWSEILGLWRLFDRRCAYCRSPLAMTALEAEHVVPLSRGGRNDLSNLLPSCKACNSDKRDLLLSEWSQDRARRHLKQVVTLWTTDDKRYWHLNIPSNLAATAA